MKCYSFRLRPNSDLKAGIMRFAEANGIRAGSIVTCVGSLHTVVLRMAGAKPGQQDIRTLHGPHEIISLVGTFGGEECHLHLAVSNADGTVTGGHLKDGTIVETTAEIVLIESEQLVYGRELDMTTGFAELKILPRL